MNTFDVDTNTTVDLSEIPLIKYIENENVNPEMRNVKDEYKFLSTEEIVDQIHRNEMINVCMNLTSDFNKASIVRASNAHAGGDIILVGKKGFDRRGTVGTHHYERIRHDTDIFHTIDVLKRNGYTVFAVDNTPEFNPLPVDDVNLPDRSAFIYGEERAGLSNDVVAACDHAIYIEQEGAVRSMNVAQAAATVMYEYKRQKKIRDRSR